MLQRNTLLKTHNTFGINASASFFASFKSEEELLVLLKENKNHELFILGGGSNILFTKNFEGLVLKNEIEGFNTIQESDNSVLVEAGAGMNWHEFVIKCLDLNFGGVENLSLIPGNVGASPMQNIGAYGVEIKDVFEYLDAIHIKTGTLKRFTNEDCAFGYRESIFKNKFKGQYIICRVGFRLTKEHVINTSYGAINKELENQNILNPNIKDVSNAVIAIRKSKLPDPNKIGNAGSFFKNPIIPRTTLTVLKEKYPSIPNYPAGNESVKLAAGWLIEQAGWKGKTFNESYGVHKNQALVLVNYGNASGNEILNLSNLIIEDVKEKFGVHLEREVNIL
jgi:UDP-N-acetylmuramate dehydrogenase